VQNKKRKKEILNERTQDVLGRLNPQLQHSVELAQEKGSLAWLTVLPVAKDGFHLHKGEFHDALCLRLWVEPQQHTSLM